MLWHVHSILNVLKYGLTLLTLIPEKMANFHKHYNGKSFLYLIWNKMWLQRRIFKNCRYYKVGNIWILNQYRVEPGSFILHPSHIFFYKDLSQGTISKLNHTSFTTENENRPSTTSLSQAKGTPQQSFKLDLWHILGD